MKLRRRTDCEHETRVAWAIVVFVAVLSVFVLAAYLVIRFEV